MKAKIRAICCADLSEGFHRHWHSRMSSLLTNFSYQPVELPSDALVRGVAWVAYFALGAIFLLYPLVVWAIVRHSPKLMGTYRWYLLANATVSSTFLFIITVHGNDETLLPYPLAVYRAHGMRSKDINRFVEHTLRADGVLLLQFVRQHVGGRVTYDLLNELLRIHWGKNNCAGSETTHQTESGSGAKGTPLSSPGGCGGEKPASERYRVFAAPPKGASPAKPSAPPTYKPTLYGPAGLHPGGYGGGMDLIDGNNAHSMSMFGSPVMERGTPIPSIDEPMDEEGHVSTTPSQAGTLPLKELRVKSSGNRHIYAPGPHSPRTPNGKNSPHLLSLSRGNSPITTRSFTTASPRLATTIVQAGPNGNCVTVSKNASNV